MLTAPKADRALALGLNTHDHAVNVRSRRRGARDGLAHARGGAAM